VLENLAQVHTHHGCIEKHGEAIDADLGSKFGGRGLNLASRDCRIRRRENALNVVLALALRDRRAIIVFTSSLG